MSAKDRAAHTHSAITTIDELLALAHGGSGSDRRLELDEGRVIESAPAAYKHGLVAGEMHRLIANDVRKHDLGEVFAAETGFVLSLDAESQQATVRAPDVAFVATSRLAAQSEGFCPGAPDLPDLAVEVVSPSETVGDIRHKLRQYLAAGVRLVVVAYVDEAAIDVHQQGGPVVTLRAADNAVF